MFGLTFQQAAMCYGAGLLAALIGAILGALVMIYRGQRPRRLDPMQSPFGDFPAPISGAPVVERFDDLVTRAVASTPDIARLPGRRFLDVSAPAVGAPLDRNVEAAT